MSKFFIDREEKISHFGDMNQHYAGSVVKALASAKHGVHEILKSLHNKESKNINLEIMQKQLTATIQEMKKLAPNILEIIVHAPLAVQNFQPGQFYKFQNFEIYAREKKTNYPPVLEPLALTGSSVDKEKGLLSLIILQNGTSSFFCEHLSVGEEVVLMGPTGEPTYIPKEKNVLLLGGGLGNAVLFSIAEALKNNGCMVYYFAAYRTQDSRFKTEEIEKYADKVFWICEDSLISASRKQDESFRGNIIEAMTYFKNYFSIIDHMIVIGSDKMMQAVAKARFHTLQDLFTKNPKLIGSINSPMQCMMKGICGQCVQVYKDPQTCEEKVFFSCAEQDQDLKNIDFQCLNNRLQRNSVQEKLDKEFMKYV